MTDDLDSKEPSTTPQGQTISQPPVPTAPTGPTENKITADPKQRTNGEQETAKELAREFRWVEFWQLIINGVLAIIGIIAL